VTAQETRYFASSLDPAAVTPADLLGLVRGHWGVENRLHYPKEWWGDEDRHYRCRPGLAERFALLMGGGAGGAPADAGGVPPAAAGAGRRAEPRHRASHQAIHREKVVTLQSPCG
jgi:hypothetical protein